MGGREAGVNWVRIRGEKTTIEEAVSMIKLCHEVGLKCSYDTNGKKPRVRQSEGMTQVQEGRERGNWLKTLVINEEMVLISEDADRYKSLEQAGVEPDMFAVRMSYLPQVFQGNGKEKISFADGKIVCSVKKVVEEEGKTREIVVTVDSVKDTEGLFWKMGANSTTNDIFSGDDPALTESDEKALEKLKELLPDDQPDQVAVSFVSTEEQAADAVRKIRDLGYGSTVLAKIETIRGVKEVKGIAKHCDLEVARGDLTDACELNGKMTLDEAEGLIILGGWDSGRKVIIATHVADTLLQKVRSGEFRDGERLSQAELLNIVAEFPVSEGVMLAAETKTIPTTPYGIEVIKSTNAAIKEAEDYWRGKLKISPR